MSFEDNRPWSEVFYEASQDWVDKESAAQLLEDTKSAVFAQKCSLLGNIPVNKAEQIVKSSDEWIEHIEKISAARTAANRAKVKVEYIRMKANEWNNSEANARAESRR